MTVPCQPREGGGARDREDRRWEPNDGRHRKQHTHWDPRPSLGAKQGTAGGSEGGAEGDRFTGGWDGLEGRRVGGVAWGLEGDGGGREGRARDGGRG